MAATAAQIVLEEKRCTGCGECVRRCPFGAIEITKGHAELNAACRACGACVKACPEKALIRLETADRTVDKSQWRDILVIAETSGGRLHPVSLELIGKARRMAGDMGWRVRALLMGSGMDGPARELLHYGADEAAVYDDPALAFFRADVYAACAEDYIRAVRPSVVLVGATSLGRSLAPRLAVRFHTGLTADCTQLELRPGSDLVQIRPAFGGNIMAQIVTANTRPQFATVRYKVMDAPERTAQAAGTIVPRALPAGAALSPVRHVATRPIAAAATISDAEILVVGGRGLAKAADLDMVRQLAELLGGDWAVSRPLVEKGWAPGERQIGLSGRTVRPKLIITCGVSGAIQFTTCMRASEHIVAINTDEDAPIFAVAHVAVVADIYDVLPRLIARLKGGS